MDCIAATRGATRCFQFDPVTCAAYVLRRSDQLDSFSFSSCGVEFVDCLEIFKII